MVSETAKSADSKSPTRTTTTAVTPASTPAEVHSPSAGSKPNSRLHTSVTPMSADVRRLMIAEAAYYIAERRGFAAGGELEDWLLAEKQIDATLSGEAVRAQAV